MAYSLEIRKEAIEYWKRCNDIEKVIEAYGVSRSTLFSWKQRQKRTGTLVSPLLYSIKSIIGHQSLIKRSKTG